MLVLNLTEDRYGLVDRDGEWYPLPLGISPNVAHGLVSDGILMMNKGMANTTQKNVGFIEIRKSDE